ncbi:non-homologous end-joining DNA ligase [Nocardioides sp. CBS4Y-1]|uniref:DNA ligase (ATP) n=2 Tax=Nocardioides acrostichi TaxID=2784339 RepID=A0A930Y7S5_9ACTN|nr:non-homologous end-joining DNA ligase [Nocardioides acrostichi]
MLATKADHVPSGPEWTHEVKWDGVRALAEVSPGGVGLWSRNLNQITTAWPDLLGFDLPSSDLLVDGEIIVLGERGTPDFRVLAERMHVRSARAAETLARRLPATYMVFDLLRLDGEDLTRLPLVERRARLTDLGLIGWAVPEAYDDGAMLLEATRQQGLEGVVSKRLSSPYRPGDRSPHWRKRAHRFRRSYVVGGWRPQEGTRDRLAALLVGEPTPDGLAYRGRVGSGISGRTSAMLAEAVSNLTRSTSPFDDIDGGVPRVDAVGTTWVDPVLVVDVDTHGLGYTRLRQPSYRGLRADLTPDDLPDQS